MRPLMFIKSFFDYNDDPYEGVAMDLVLTLVFSIVMLFFMIYPAMKITEWIDKRYPIPAGYYNAVMISVVVLLSLMIGVFLRYA